LYSDLTDWSIVEPNGFPDYRYNDREIMRAFADRAIARATSAGIGFIRPLEASARKLGVEILLKHRMTAIYREQPASTRAGHCRITRWQDAEYPRAEGGSQIIALR
jgi:hypothetical protein